MKTCAYENVLDEARQFILLFDYLLLKIGIFI